MPTFVVETSQTSRFVYEVDAANVDEAMKKAESDDCEPVHEKLGEEEVTHTYERRMIQDG